MAHNTRSQTSRTPSEASETAMAEVEILQRQANEKDKLLREQAEALRRRQEELERRERELSRGPNAAVDINDLTAILAGLRQDLGKLNHLPNEIERLNSCVSELRTQVTHIQTQSFIPDYPESLFDNPATEPSPVIPIQSPVTPKPPQQTESSFMRVKDVIDGIPRYDGQKMSVYYFSKICERTLKLISPAHEYQLVQIIINKLQGHAYTAVEGMNFSQISSLTRHLKLIFGHNKSLNQYRGELGNIYMYHNESLFSYIERIKELKTAIIDGELEAISSRMREDQIRDQVDKEACDSFVKGLPSDLLVRLELHGGYYSLDDAIAIAIQLSKTLEAEARRRRPIPNKPTLSPPRVDYPPRFTPQSNLTITSSRPFIKPLVPGQPGPNAPTVEVCNYCKTPGHHISTCRKLAYRRAWLNNQRPPINQPVAGSSGQQPNAILKNPENHAGVPVNNGVRPNAAATGHQDPNLARAVRFNAEQSPRRE